MSGLGEGEMMSLRSTTVSTTVAVGQGEVVMNEQQLVGPRSRNSTKNLRELVGMWHLHVRVTHGRPLVMISSFKGLPLDTP